MRGRGRRGELADIVEVFASRPNEWMGQVRLCADRRWYERLYHGPDYDEEAETLGIRLPARSVLMERGESLRRRLPPCSRKKRRRK
jgi:hypothetical protein